MENKIKNLFDAIYEKPGENPWTNKEPPKELVELIESGKIKPCKVLDVGCGEGYNSIYLASKGFDVTGIDFSEKAIQLAKNNSKEAGLDCKFLKMDWRELIKLDQKFDFVFEWRFFHEILEEKEREEYTKIVHSLLNQGGKYLSTSFSMKVKYWGTEKIRINPLVMIPLYLASQEDLEKLFIKHFKILEKREIILVSRGTGEVPYNYFFMEK